MKIHKKQRLYNKVRGTQKDQDLDKFMNLRKHIKELLMNAHDSYVL